MSGVVSALAPGDAIVTASADGIGQTLRLRITARRVATVSISLPPGALHVGDRVQLVAKAKDTSQELIAEPIRWASEDAVVAAVSTDGVLTARAPGDARIWAEAQGVRGEARVRIDQMPVAGVRLIAPAETVEIGGRLLFSATPFGARNETLDNRAVTWASTDPLVATIDDSGELEALAAGRTLVTCTCEGKRASILLLVAAPPPLPVPVPTIDESPPVEVLVAADPAPAPAPAPAPPVLAKQPVTPLPPRAKEPERLPSRRRRRVFTASAGGAAVLLVLAWLAIKAGSRGSEAAQGQTAPIASSKPDTAATKVETSLAGRGETATVQPAATPAIPATTATSVRIRGLPAAIVVGDSFTLLATATDARQATLADRAIRWTSRSPSIVTVDSTTGRARAVGEGRAIVIARVDGVTSTVDVVVAKKPVSASAAAVSAVSLRIAPQDTSLRVGESVTLSATIGGATWSSDNTAVATVDSRGQLTAMSPGNALITARAPGTTATATVTVRAVAVAQVLPDPPTATMTVGATLRLQASARDERGSLLAGRPIAWHSENSDIASVDSAGLVTAHQAGAAVLLASAEGRVGRVSVTVAPKAGPVAPPATTVNPPIDRTVADRAAARAAAERAIGLRIQEFVDALNAHNAERVRSALNDSSSWGQIEDKVSNRALQLRAGSLKRGQTQIGDAQATADFSVTLNWLNPIRRPKDHEGSFRATFVQRGGTWSLQSIRILGGLD